MTHRGTGSVTLSGTITNTGGITFANSSTGALTVSGAIANAGGITVNGAGTGTVTLGGVISGTAGLTLYSSATVTKANNYTGATTLNGGVLTVSNATALGDGGDIIFDGGTLKYGSGITADISSRIHSSVGSIAIDTGVNASITYASAIDSTNTGGLTKSGTGDLILDGVNAYSGATTVAAGNLVVNGSLAAASAVAVQSGATLSGSGTVAGTVSVADGTVDGNGLQLAALNFSGASTLSGVTNASSIQVASGTTAASGTATSTGAVSVDSTAKLTNTGTLTGSSINIALGGVLTNNGTLTGPVDVYGVLNGAGTVNGALKIKSQGELAVVGNGLEVKTINGALTVETGAKVSMQIDGTAGAGVTDGFDQLVVTSVGSVKIETGTTLSLTFGVSFTLSGEIVLIDNQSSTTIDGYFTSLTIDGSTVTLSASNTFTYNNQEYALSYNTIEGTDGVSNDLFLVAVPEPGSWAMVAGGMGMLFAFRRFTGRRRLA